MNVNFWVKPEIQGSSTSNNYDTDVFVLSHKHLGATAASRYVQTVTFLSNRQGERAAAILTTEKPAYGVPQVKRGYLGRFTL